MRRIDVFVIDEAKEEFEKLNRIVGEQRQRGMSDSEEMQALNSLKKKSEILKMNPEYGDKIPRRYWPRELDEKYKLTNLWRMELTNYWRMLYTLRGDKIEVLCFVIKLLDHPAYNKLFGYRNN